MTHRVLVPFELDDPEPVSPAVVTRLANSELVVLGHYDLPEQTPLAMGRSQHESEAQATLDELTEPFESTGVQTRLVFGRDREAVIDNVAVEQDCDAELIPAVVDSVERILVPIRDAAGHDRLTDLTLELAGETAEITLFHVVETSHDEADALLAGVRNQVIDRGVDPDRITTTVSDASGHRGAITAEADAHDLVVMGETDTGLTTRILGPLPDRIVEQAEVPVVVVRRDEPTD